MNGKQDNSSPSAVREFVIDWLRKELIWPAPGYPMVQLNREEILGPQDPLDTATAAAFCFLSACVIPVATRSSPRRSKVSVLQTKSTRRMGLRERTTVRSKAPNRLRTVRPWSLSPRSTRQFSPARSS
jgi:hypothetical protein